MKILVINAGSSSLKYQLYDDAKNVLAKGLCERIGLDGRLTHKVPGKDDYKAETEMKDHAQAIAIVMETLMSAENGVISDIKEIGAVGHRVVHGGEQFTDSALITDAVVKGIEACVPLAPLHNPPNLTGFRACEQVMGKDVPQGAVFDTAFHQTMPEEAYMYALPYEYYEKYAIRKYGFHGTSHKYVSQEAAKMLGKDAKDLKIVTCHLGNGSSIAAVSGGKVIDTSMGFTPLDGLPMGTRTGSMDPAVVTFLQAKEGFSPADMDNLMNKKSGVLGLSGVSSDFRDLDEAAAGGNKRAALATEVFCYQIRKFIGSYAAAMGGIDAIVFTAGVGENSSTYRARICEKLAFLGI